MTAKWVDIDGTDLHTYGMGVNSVSNPVPRAISSSGEVIGRHGDIDYVNRYSPRMMTISGTITGTSHSNLMSNLDSIKSFFRLRENQTTMKVIFQDQTDRYWLCRYDGAFNITSIGLWTQTCSVNYTLQLKCIVPYAQKTTATTSTIYLNNNYPTRISYAGDVPAPLNLKIRNRNSINLLDSAVAYATNPSDDATAWQGGRSNCTVIVDTAKKIFGVNALEMEQVLQDVMYSEIVVTAVMNASKYYVFGGYIPYVLSTYEAVYIELMNDGAGGNKTLAYTGANEQYNKFRFMKIQPSDLTGFSTLKFRIGNTATLANCVSYFDGLFVYEISAAEYADSLYSPPPYICSKDAALHIVPLSNINLKLKHNVNLLDDGSGESATGWTNAYSLSDPFDPGDRCLQLVDTSLAPTIPVKLSEMPVPAGSVYKISYKYYCPSISGTVKTSFTEYIEGQTGTNNGVDMQTINAVVSAWTSATYRYFPATSTSKMALKFTLSSADTLFYVKDIIIEEEIVRASPYSAYTTFVKHEDNQFKWDEDIEYDDNLYFSSERFQCEFNDHSAKTVANEIAHVNPMERLMLEPGTNILTMDDARNGDSTPELTSSGSAEIMITYRERYL
jgi:predicted phage tail component-like protein